MEETQETRPRTPRFKRVWRHKLWLALFRARRSARKLEKRLRAVVVSHRAEVTELTDRYEEHLAIERARYTQMMEEWASRLLQATGQQAILKVSPADSIVDPRFKPKPDFGDPEEILSVPQQERLAEEKQRFFQEGEENGFSRAEVLERWKEVKPSVIEDLW